MECRVAVDTMAEEAAYANAPASADDDDDLVSCRPRFNIEDVALVSSNEKVYVRAGDSICYNHKVEMCVLLAVYCIC